LDFFLEKITLLLRTVTNLKYEVRDYGLKIDRLENTVMNNMNKSVTENNCNTELDLQLFDFPIKTFEELNIFENKLMDKPFRLQMVNNLN